MEPVPNGSSPKIEPHRPSFHMGPFWNQPGTDPKLDPIFCRSNLNLFQTSSITSCANRSRPGFVQNGSGPVPCKHSLNFMLCCMVIDWVFPN